MIVKLTRTLMIVPVTLVLAFYTSRGISQKDELDYKFSKIFPWFVIGFVAASTYQYHSYLIPTMIKELLVNSGKFLIVMAMAAIGT